MQTADFNGLKGREKLIEYLAEKYLSNISSPVTIINGGHGSGKSYIMNTLIEKIKKKYYIYENSGDNFISLNKSDNGNNINSISFSIGIAGFSGGLGIGFQNDYSILNQVKKMIKHKNNVLFCLDNFSNASNSVKNILLIILNNYLMLSDFNKKKIYFLVNDTSENVKNYFINFFPNIETILLNNYNENDILEYLKYRHLPCLLTEEFKKKLSNIQKISLGNLNLVDYLFNDIQLQSFEYFEALEQIVKYRFDELKEMGYKQNISNFDLEEIIITTSFCIKNFSVNEISKIIHKNESLVFNTFNLAYEKHFILKNNYCLYYFQCEEIKNILFNLGKNSYKEKLLYFYKYYSENKQDEYYMRAYYLFLYFNFINSQAFTLLLLSYVCSATLNDNQTICNINNLINNHCDINQKMIFKLFVNFYYTLKQKNKSISELYKMYYKLTQNNLELPLIAEINRLFFLYLYRNNSPFDNQTKRILDKCIQYSKNTLKLSYIENTIEIDEYDETIIRVTTIYTILPFILDVQNDLQLFNDLFNLANKLSKSIKNKKVNSILQYMEHVFYRKAFLFVNQTQCEIYYNKACLFFEQNHYWLDYCLTLINSAGTDIVIQEYQESIKKCNKALKISKEENFLIPQIAKLKNNCFIASFLEYESKSKDFNDIKLYAEKTVKKLVKQLSEIRCATNFVILTNICSLSLYCENFILYDKYKRKIERLMNCKDISNVLDDNIDDFYRYYFAWFEIFKFIKSRQWEEANKLAQLLNNFVPTLFKKQEIFWDKKLNALFEIIHNKTLIDSFSFCNNLVRTDRRETILCKFFYRGLMLSDLQYTSFI